ncbi:unnamed protein product, partial [Dovyalis caffra]
IRSLDPSILWRNHLFELWVGVKFTMSGWEVEARLEPGRPDPQSQTRSPGEPDLRPWTNEKHYYIRPLLQVLESQIVKLKRMSPGEPDLQPQT